MADHRSSGGLAAKRIEKAQRARQEAQANLALFEAEKRAVAEKTARLKALRLARDAAVAERASAEPTPRKPAKVKK